MEPHLLQVTGLCKTYGNRQVLSDVTMHLDRGERVGIIGPSGSGKSTLLRCINLLEWPTSGIVSLEGKVLGVEQTARGLVRARERVVVRQRQQFGMVFQHFNLFPHLTALQNVILALRKVKGMTDKEASLRGGQELEKVGLSDRSGSYPDTLSGGEQQRVAIARALALDPKVMLFDEPTSALDPELVGDVLAVIQSLAEDGMTLTLVTHDIRFALKISDRVLVMEAGRIVETGSPRDLRECPSHPRTKSLLTGHGS